MPKHHWSTESLYVCPSILFSTKKMKKVNKIVSFSVIHKDQFTGHLTSPAANNPMCHTLSSFCSSVCAPTSRNQPTSPDRHASAWYSLASDRDEWHYSDGNNEGHRLLGMCTERLDLPGIVRSVSFANAYTIHLPMPIREPNISCDRHGTKYTIVEYSDACWMQKWML